MKNRYSHDHDIPMRGEGLGRFDTMSFRPGMDDGHFDTMPHRPGMDDGHFGTMPRRPDMDDGHFDTMPRHPGSHEDRGFEGRRGPGGHGRHGGPEGRPRRGHRGPDMPEDMLMERIEDASLLELLELAGRMAHRRPGGDAGRGQALVLSILAGRESMSQRALQQLLGVQPGSVSELVSKLERKGLVTRERDEDRRGNLLRLTDAGRAALPTGAESPEDDLFSALTENQKTGLREALTALLKDWMSRLAPQGRFAPPAEDDGPRDAPRTEKV